MNGFVYKNAPRNILHSWVEVFFEDKCYELEAFILDQKYLSNLQKKFANCTGVFCGYGMAVKDFQHPIIDFDRNNTYIQSEGIKQDFGVYDSPDEFNFTPSRYFKFGKFIGAASHFQILASELSDRMLAEFLDIDDNINISFHIKAIEQSEAIKMVKRKNTDIDKMKIEENKKAVRSGYDMDILPSDLITYGEDVKSLLKDLQTRDERMFVVTIIFMNFARTIQRLDNTISQISSIANKHNCKLKRLDHSQEQGLISVLPLGVNKIEIDRGLTSSSTAVFMPFTTE